MRRIQTLLSFAISLLLCGWELSPAVATPVLFSMSPRSAAAAGATITFIGRGFLSDNTVRFGNTTLQHIGVSGRVTVACATDPQCVRNTTQMLTFLVPANASPGDYAVSVQNSDGTSNAITLTVIPPLTVSNTNDLVNGCTSSPTCLIKHPGPDGISLREAIMAVNNVPGPNAITFAAALAGKTIKLSSRLPPITRGKITLTGLTTSTGQPNVTIDASQASNPGPVLFIAASHFTVSGLNFSSIPMNFNGIQIGGSGFGLMGHSVSSPAQVCCVQIIGNAFSNGTGDNTFAIFVAADISKESISDVTIANNSFSQLFEAINLQGGGGDAKNSVIENIIIFGNSFSQMTSNGTSAVEVGTTNGKNNVITSVQIVQNEFSGNLQGTVLDINGSTSGSSIKNTVIARNVFVGNLQAMGLEAGVNTGTTNNVIDNTQIVDNLVNLTGYKGKGAVTIQINDNQSGTNNKVTGVSFVNNTIYNGTSSAPPGWGVWVTSDGGVTGVSIWNSIFWGNESTPALNGITSSGQVSYTIIDQSGFSGVNGNINADPLFVNTSSGDFQLQSGSPAINAGTSVGAPSTDLDCQPFGKPPSIGAYELQGQNICSSTPPPP